MSAARIFRNIACDRHTITVNQLGLCELPVVETVVPS